MALFRGGSRGSGNRFGGAQATEKARFFRFGEREVRFLDMAEATDSSGSEANSTATA